MDPQAQAPHGSTTPPQPPQSPHPKLPGRRNLILGSILAIALVAGTGWLAWHLTHPDTTATGSAGAGARPGAGGRRGAAPTTVGVATAERASIPVVLDALGTVVPQATVKVRPQVSGVLEKVLFNEGQMVRAGQVLATIDARQFDLALQQASGQRQRDEAQLDAARVTLQRQKTLLEQDSIARQDVDSQAALVKQLEGTVQIDKANEGVARLNLSYARVLAPISGRIGLRSVDVGNVVNASDANGIAVITQISPIDVVFAVPQDQAGDLQRAAAAGTVMKAQALDRTRATTLDTGAFASLDNQADVTTGTVKAKARFANAQLALFPSQFVNVRLQLRTIDNAVVVPVTALRHGNDGDYVYVVNAADRTVSQRAVTRGQASVDKVIVASGLQAGEQVITEGADRLKDGSTVVLPGDAPAGPPRGAASGAVKGKRTGASGGSGARTSSRGAPASAAVGGADAAAPAAAGVASSPQRRRSASQAEGS